MPALRFLSVLLALSLAAKVAAAGGAFLAELEDLPLPSGLTESAGGLLFDSPGGRIIEATATGDLSAGEIKAFYAETLPQLGWQATGDMQFKRDGERLHIVIEDNRHPLVVHFSVTPH